MERLIQNANRLVERIDKRALLEEALFLLDIASKIVDLVIDESNEQPA